MYRGKVVGLAWEEWETPKFKVEYLDGSSAWHDSVDEAGISVRLVKGEEMNKTQKSVRDLIGHG